MPTIRERDPDLVYTRAERENSWSAILLVVLLMVTLAVFAFLLLSRDQDRQRVMDQLNQLRIQEQQPPVSVPTPQPIAVPVPQPIPVPITQPVPQVVPTPVPVPVPSPQTESRSGRSDQESGTNPADGSSSLESPPSGATDSTGSQLNDAGSATTP